MGNSSSSNVDDILNQYFGPDTGNSAPANDSGSKPAVSSSANKKSTNQQPETQQNLSPAVNAILNQHFGPPTAADIQQQQQSQPQPNAPLTGAGLAKSAATGLGEGVVATPFAPTDIGAGLGKMAAHAIDKYILGRTPDQIAQSDAAAAAVNARDPLAVPTGQQAIQAAQSVTGPWYQPQNGYERTAESAGQLAPILLSPGSAAQRVLSYGGALGGNTASKNLLAGSAWEPYVTAAATMLGGYGGAKVGDYASIAPPPGMNRTATAMVQKAVTPQDVANMQKLGPEAMVMDASPATGGYAGGIISEPGANKNAITAAVTNRDAGTGNRLASDVNANFGPYQEPVGYQNSLQAAYRAQMDPQYKAVFSNAPPVDPKPIVAMIDQKLATATGPARAALTKWRSELVESPAVPPTPPVRTAVQTPNGGTIYRMVGGSPGKPETYVNNPELLHDLKGTIDGTIKYGDPALGVAPGALQREQGAASAVRNGINDLLKNNVPGYKQVTDQSAEHLQSIAAVEDGTNILQKGKTAVPPSVLANKLAAAVPGVKTSMQVGSRHAIENTVGTNANDLASLKSQIGNQSDWNAQKLAMLHGQPQTQNLLDAIHREAQFNGLKNRLVGNSETANRQAALRSIEAPDLPRIGNSATLFGTAANAATSAGRAVANAVLRMRHETTKNALTNALLKKGPAGVQLLNDILANNPPPTALRNALTGGALSLSGQNRGP